MLEAEMASQELENDCLTCNWQVGADSLSVQNDENISVVLRKHFWFTEVDFQGAMVCRTCWNKVNQFHQFYVSVENLYHNRLASVIVKSEPAVVENDCLEMSSSNLDVRNDIQECPIVVKEEPPLEISDTNESNNEENKVKNDPNKVLEQRKFPQLVENSSSEQAKLEDSYIQTHVKYICKHCGQDSSSFLIHLKHSLDEHGVKPSFFECCGKKYFKRGALYQHVLVLNNPDIFRCEQCGKCFGYKAAFLKHIKEQHGSGKAQRLKCDRCPGKFIITSNYRRHIKMHQEQELKLIHPCANCPETFSSSRLLKDHVASVHKDIRQFKCAFCVKTFLYDANLVRHKKMKHPNEMMEEQKLSSLADSKFLEESLPELYGHNREAEIQQQKSSTLVKEEPALDVTDETITEGVQSNDEQEDKKLDGYGQNSILDFCGKQYSSKIPDRFHCLLCTQNFNKKSELQRHKTDVHEDGGRFRCEWCPRKYRYQSEYKRHIKHHLVQEGLESKAVYPCSDCQRTFSTPSILKNHIAVVHQGIFKHKCSVCERTFKSSWAMRKHQKTQHPNETLNEVKEESPQSPEVTGNDCLEESTPDLSSILVKEEPALDIVDENRPDSVQSSGDEEDSRYKTKEQNQKEDDYISEHVKFTCKQCGQCSPNFSTFVRHSLDVHGKKSTVECCGKQYRSKYLLYNHVQVVNDPNIFSCKLCQTNFNHKYGLVRHMVNIHENEYKFKCDQCPKKFAYKSQHYRHIKWHKVEEGIEPKVRYPCTECPRKFSSGILLRDHVASIHKGISLHKCTFCEMKFNSKGILQRHKIKNHPNEGQPQRKKIVNEIL